MIGCCAKKAEGKRALDRPHPSLLYAIRKPWRSRKSRRERAWPRPYLRSRWPGSSKKTCAPGMRLLRRPRLLPGWIAGSLTLNRIGLPNCALPCPPFAVSRQEILAFFDFLPTRLSNGLVEGKNNRTKAIMRQRVWLSSPPPSLYLATRSSLMDSHQNHPNGWRFGLFLLDKGIHAYDILRQRGNSQ